MLRPPDWPLASCGLILPKNWTLSLISSTHFTETPEVRWKFATVPCLPGSTYRGHCAIVSAPFTGPFATSGGSAPFWLVPPQPAATALMNATAATTGTSFPRFMLQLLRFFERDSKNNSPNLVKASTAMRRFIEYASTNAPQGPNGETRTARASRPPGLARAGSGGDPGEGHRRPRGHRSELGPLLLPAHRGAAAGGIARRHPPLCRTALAPGAAARRPDQPAQARDPPRSAHRARRRGEPAAL